MNKKLVKPALKKDFIASRTLIWTGIIFFLLFFGLLLAGQRYIEYNRTLANTEDRLMAQARVVDENLGANLVFINVLLSDIMRMQYGAFSRSTTEMNAYLRHQDNLIPGIRTIFITDSHGRIVRSSKEKIIGFDGGNRDYFKTASTISDPSKLIITPPFETTLGTFVVNATKKMTGKHGEFLGILSASLDKEYFSTLLESVLYAPDNRVSLVHVGGDVFVSLPDMQPGFSGTNLVKSGSLFRRHLESGKQVSIQRGRSSMLGEERIAVLITCTPSSLKIEQPLIISVSRSRHAVLASWKRDTLILIVLYVTMCGISIAVAATMIRYRSEHRKAAEEHLKLRHLESLEILAGGITHDFNNLVTSIIGFIEIAKNESKPGDLVHETLSVAMKNCLQAGELSRRLLAFAKGGEHAKAMTSIVGLLEESVKEVQQESLFRAEIKIPKNLHAVPIDAEQMRQVFFSIVTNAKEAMPDGGSLRITGENILIAAENDLTLSAGDYIKLTFLDTGIGIATDNIPKIFDPYFSTKDTYSQKGLGLGLAVCYSVIKRHGGIITIDSQVDKGTTLSLYLPTFT